MKTGTEALETWTPLGGFKLERRKGKTPEGEILTTDWLVPLLAYDDVVATHPCAEQPCLHRVLATCPHDRIVKLAGLYGLLTAVGKASRAADLPAEPVDTWYREIRLLRNATALWDAITGKDETALHRALLQYQAAKGKELLGLARERLARQVTEKLAGGRLEMIASHGDDLFVIRHRPVRLIDAIWQRVAEEIAGMIACDPLSGSRLQQMVSSEWRPKRSPVLLSRLPDARLACSPLISCFTSADRAGQKSVSECWNSAPFQTGASFHNVVHAWHRSHSPGSTRHPAFSGTS